MRWGLASSGLLFAVFIFTALIIVKNDVRQLTRLRKDFTQQNLDLQEERRVLQAELAYLISPMNLHSYANKLDLVELNTKRMHAWEGGA